MKRYQRHIQLSGFGPEGQEALGKASVLVVGAGGLGVPVLQYLNAMGVGTIGIVDGDTVSLENLQRQVIYGDEDVGAFKAECALKSLKRQNPETHLRIYTCFLAQQNALELFHDYDLIVDASDNFGTRYLVNDACMILNKPFVYGGLHGFEGQASVFNWQNGPSYRCLFPKKPSAEEVPGCNVNGVLGILPGIIGNFMALEAIKVLTGIGNVLSGELLTFNALNQESRKIRFRRVEEHCAIKQLETDYDTPCSMLTITIQDFLKLEGAYLVDVRSEPEFSSDHLGSAINVPLELLEAEFRPDESCETVYFICASGQRSERAVQILAKRYPNLNLVNVLGGMRALQAIH